MKPGTICLALLLVAPVAGCGGDDDGGGADAGVLANPGFATPDIVTTAFTESGEAWNEVGPANWDCLNTATDDEESSVAITVSGVVRDFQDEDETITGAEIEVFAGNNISGTAIATTTSIAGGEFSVELPLGTERVTYRTEAEDYMPTFLMNQYYQPNDAAQEEDLEPISVSLANALTAFINKQRTLGLGVLAGAIRDCDGNEVKGAIATVSTTSKVADHQDGAETYYFSAGAQSLPVRLTQEAYTNDDGLFMIIELPPTSSNVFLQVWGFVDGQDPASDELTLISELASPVVGDTIISASMEALRN